MRYRETGPPAPLSRPGAAKNVCPAAMALLCTALVFAAAVSAAAADVKLAWDPNTDSGLAGYNVYYGTQSRVYSNSVKLGLQTAYTVASLPPGTYYFAVTAYNTAGLESGYSNEVSTIIVAAADTTPPSITITAPTGASTFVTTGAALTVSGTASDNVGVTQVMWSDSAGGSGIAAGTAAWSASIALSPGANTITVTASDAAGNTSRATLTVTFNATSRFDLNGDGLVNVLDLQLLTNVILGAPCQGSCDLNGDSSVNVLDLQLLTNAILGVGT